MATDVWRTVTCGEIAEINGARFAQEFDDTDVIEYIDASSIDAQGRIRARGRMLFRDAPAGACWRARPNDTIVRVRRPELGGVAFVDDSWINVVVSNVFAVLTPGPEVDPRFLFESVLRDEFKRFIFVRRAGSLETSLSLRDLAAAPILLPPLAQQKKISRILGVVDEVGGGTEHVISCLHDMEHALTAGAQQSATPAQHEALATLVRRIELERVALERLRQARVAISHVLFSGSPLLERAIVARSDTPQSSISLVPVIHNLGYNYVPRQELDAERAGDRSATLSSRVSVALRRLNPAASPAELDTATRALAEADRVAGAQSDRRLRELLLNGFELESGHRIRYIDYTDSRANDLMVTTDFRVEGVDCRIVFDLAIFVNGLPIAIIVNASGQSGARGVEPGVDQLVGDQQKALDRGVFAVTWSTTQVCIVLDNEQAVIGALRCKPTDFAAWRVPFPLSVDAFEREVGHSPSSFEVLARGALTPENLVDLVANFIAVNDDGERKMARYFQFAAVRLALERSLGATRAQDRGGLIWHAPGSGVTHTLLWLAQKLRNDPRTNSPVVLVVSDRRTLDEQLWRAFQASGVPASHHARSAQDLVRRILHGSGTIVVTTIQKFLYDEAVAMPPLTNVFVLAVEAHRSQYGALAVRMRQALPDAVFFGFTATPVEREDRSTVAVFGRYLHRYSIAEAVGDRLAVPVWYERRSELAALEPGGEGGGLHGEAARGGRRLLTFSRKRVDAVSADIVAHLRSFVLPAGFKALLLAASVEAAHAYHASLQRFDGIHSEVISATMTDGPLPGPGYRAAGVLRERTLEQFRRRDDSLSLLITADVTLAGVHSPYAQVLYLDAPIREHTLLQAIAHIGGVAPGKAHGVVIDYCGILDDVSHLLSAFSARDVSGAIIPIDVEIERLAARHAALMRIVRSGGPRHTGAPAELAALLETAGLRAEFMAAFTRFQHSLKMLLPNRLALSYVEDGARLKEVFDALRGDTRYEGYLRS